MATNQTVNNLGSAEGRIIIDVSSLKDASAIVAAFARQTMAALAPISAALTNLANISKATSTIYVQQLKLQATEAEAAADIEIAAIKARSEAEVNATKIAVQQSKERMAQQKQEAAEAERSGGGSSAKAATRPAGLARSILGLGIASQSIGLDSVSKPLFEVGGLAQIVEEIPIFNAQIDTMAARLLSAEGVFGGLARAGAQLAVSLGGAADGMAVAFASVAAVALPVIAVIGVLAAALQAVENNFQHAADEAQKYIEKQDRINQLVAAGATGEDVTKDVATQQTNFDLTKKSLDALEPLMDIIRRGGVLPQVVQAAQGYKPAEALSGFLPGIQEINDKIKTASQGQFSDANALVQAYIKLTAELQANAGAVENTAAAAGDTGIELNTLNAAYNDQAAAAIAAAKFTQDLSRASSQQLQDRLADNRSEADSIQQNAALLTGKQLDAAVAREDQLDKEKKLIEALLPAAYVKNLQDFGKAFADLFSSSKLQQERTETDRLIDARQSADDANLQQTRALQDQSIARLQQQQDFGKQQSRAQEDYLTSRAKAEKQYDEQQEQAEEDHQSKMLQIIADARLDILKAAAQLDARAVYQDQQRRDQQLAKENTDFSTARTRQQQQYQEQQADQQAQFELQRSRANADFEETVQRQDAQRALQFRRQHEDYDLQTQRQQEQYALQDQRRDTDFQNQTTKLIQHNQVIQALFGLGLQGLQDQIATFWTKVNKGASPILTGANQIGQAVGNIFNTQRLGSTNLAPYRETKGTTTPFPTFDNGGVNMFPGIFASNVPEAHIPLSMMAGMGGDIHLHGDIVLGDIGDRSDSDVELLIERGLRAVIGKGLQRYAGTSS